MQKVALITGASKGIGAAVAKKLAFLDIHVVLVARNIKGLEKVDDEIKAENPEAQTTLVPLDLSELDKIDELALQINQKFGKLDILIANAGLLGGLSPISHITNKTWDSVLTLNLSANHRLIRAFNLLLKKSSDPRAVFVTSAIVGTHRPFWGIYSITKTALEDMVKIYANEEKNITVNMIDPGAVATEMRAQAYPGEDPNTLRKPEDIAELFVKITVDKCTVSGQIFKAY